MSHAKTAIETLENETLTMNPAGNKRTIDDYLRAAKIKNGLKSYRELARRLNKSQTHINDLRYGKKLPSDEVMMEIARLAGVDPSEALLDLCILRASGDAKKEYEAIFGKFKKILASLLPATLFGLVFAAPKAAFASIDRALSALPPTLLDCVMSCYNIVYYGN